MNNKHGILLMVLSMFAFATSDAFIKGASGVLTTGQIILWLGVCGAVLFSLLAILKGQKPFTMGFFTAPVLIRNIAEMFATVGIISSIQLTTISATSSIQQALPLTVTLGAVLFLSEKVGWRRWCAIISGFLFVLLIIRPGSGEFTPYSLLAVLGVVGLTFRDLATKWISDDVTTIQLSAYGYIALIPAGLLMVGYSGADHIPPIEGWPIFICILSASMLAYIAITASVRVAEISAVVPFRYTRLMFALIYGIVFFGERPDWQTLIGAAGIIASGLFLLVRERQA